MLDLLDVSRYATVILTVVLVMVTGPVTVYAQRHARETVRRFMMAASFWFAVVAVALLRAHSFDITVVMQCIILALAPPAFLGSLLILITLVERDGVDYFKTTPRCFFKWRLASGFVITEIANIAIRDFTVGWWYFLSFLPALAGWVICRWLLNHYLPAPELTPSYMLDP